MNTIPTKPNYRVMGSGVLSLALLEVLLLQVHSDSPYLYAAMLVIGVIGAAWMYVNARYITPTARFATPTHQAAMGDHAACGGQTRSRQQTWARAADPQYLEVVYLDIEANKHDLNAAFRVALLCDPDKIVFIGTDPVLETRAKEAGYGVGVLPVGTQLPVSQLRGLGPGIAHGYIAAAPGGGSAARGDHSASGQQTFAQGTNSMMHQQAFKALSGVATDLFQARKLGITVNIPPEVRQDLLACNGPQAKAILDMLDGNVSLRDCNEDQH